MKYIKDVPVVPFRQTVLSLTLRQTIEATPTTQSFSHPKMPHFSLMCYMLGVLDSLPNERNRTKSPLGWEFVRFKSSRLSIKSIAMQKVLQDQNNSQTLHVTAIGLPRNGQGWCQRGLAVSRQSVLAVPWSVWDWHLLETAVFY